MYIDHLEYSTFPARSISAHAHKFYRSPRARRHFMRAGSPKKQTAAFVVDAQLVEKEKSVLNSLSI